MAKNLVLFTAGIDSTYIVYKLLNETSDEITLLILCSKENNTTYAANKNAVLGMQPIISILKKVRNFQIIYHIVDNDLITSWKFENATNYAIKTFADKFNDGTYDKLVTGASWEQTNGQFFKHSTVRGLFSAISPPKIFSELTTKGSLWQPLHTHDFHQNYNRTYAFTHLPEPLKNLTLSKSPINTKFVELIKNGYTAENINDWLQTKNREYGGGQRDGIYTTWMYLEMNSIIPGSGIKNSNKGLALDFQGEIVSPITTKDQYIHYLSSIEYTDYIDYNMQKWNLTAADWDPENP